MGVIAILTLLLIGTHSEPEDTDAGGPITLYAAAGMRLPVEEVLARYRDEFGRDVVTEYGGSGHLLATLRVERGEPRADLYLAADDDYIARAREHNLVAESIPVARMRPVIAVSEANPAEISSLEDLLGEDVRVALANPELAAIGRISREILEKKGLWSDVEKRSEGFSATVSFVGTVTEVANNLKLGTAQAGIVWDATLQQYPSLRGVEDERLASGVQDVTIAVVRSTPRPTAALHLARFLTASDRGLQAFARHGWKTVAGDAWADRPELVVYSGGVNRPAIEETLRTFEAREGATITVKYGGCGILVSDMRAIASGDLPSAFPDAYFACDRSFIPPVEDEFLDPMELSATSMVLLVREGNPKGIRGLQDLARLDLRIATANEEHSALGALTKKLLENEGIYEAVKAKVTYQAPSADPLVLRMRTGQEDVAVVYEANCSKIGNDLEIIHIDNPLAAAVQPFVIGRASQHQQMVARLRAALLSAESRHRFEAVGFQWRAATDH